MFRAPQVRTLTIPLIILGRGATQQYWPRLTHLSIDIYETQMFTSGLPRPRKALKRFPWEGLQCLLSLPPLETVELRVRGAHGSESPTLDDARDLKACLDSLSDCIPREVHVHGFQEDVAHEMPVLANEVELYVVFH